MAGWVVSGLAARRGGWWALRWGVWTLIAMACVAMLLSALDCHRRTAVAPGGNASGSRCWCWWCCCSAGGAPALPASPVVACPMRIDADPERPAGGCFTAWCD